ncbi:MAG: FHA domain-containing protein [Gaiella sp.]
MTCFGPAPAAAFVLQTPWGIQHIPPDGLRIGRTTEYSPLGQEISSRGFDNVSGRHAIIRIEDGAVVVEDVGSKNGTYVDGVDARTADENRIIAQPGALIQLALDPPLELRVEHT